MREYALITLDMIKYFGIFLKKESAEYDRILKESDAVDSIRSLCKLLSSYRDRHIQNTVKHFNPKMNCFFISKRAGHLYPLPARPLPRTS